MSRLKQGNNDLQTKQLGFDNEMHPVGNGSFSQNNVICRSSKTLAEAFPDIAAEWHPTKNGGLKPTDVTPGSERSVWWICEKRHPNPDYLYPNLFYQGVTRVRESLALIVVQATNLFDKIVSIVDPNEN